MLPELPDVIDDAQY